MCVGVHLLQQQIVIMSELLRECEDQSQSVIFSLTSDTGNQSPKVIAML